MKTVFTSALGYETELVRAQLDGAGFRARVVGAAHASGLMLVVGGLESEVVVPDEEFEAAQAFLLDSKVLLDGATPSGVVPSAAVCPVHEQRAVAICERCGTFLCSACGALGDPPICEDCVARPDASRPRPAWVLATARLWAGAWIGAVLLVTLVTIAMIAVRYTGNW
jgi:hypothetical protein